MYVRWLRDSSIGAYYILAIQISLPLKTTLLLSLVILFCTLLKGYSNCVPSLQKLPVSDPIPFILSKWPWRKLMSLALLSVPLTFARSSLFSPISLPSCDPVLKEEVFPREKANCSTSICATQSVSYNSFRTLILNGFIFLNYYFLSLVSTSYFLAYKYISTYLSFKKAKLSLDPDNTVAAILSL